MSLFFIKILLITFCLFILKRFNLNSYWFLINFFIRLAFSYFLFIDTALADEELIIKDEIEEPLKKGQSSLLLDITVTVIIFSIAGANPLLGFVCGFIINLMCEEGSEAALEVLDGLTTSVEDIEKKKLAEELELWEKMNEEVSYRYDLLIS